MEYVYKVEINYYEASGTYKWILWRKLINEKDTEWRLRSWANADTEASARSAAEILLKKDYLVNLKQSR